MASFIAITSYRMRFQTTYAAHELKYSRYNAIAGH